MSHTISREAPVQRRTEVVTAAFNRLTDMHAHAHPHRCALRPHLSCQSRLSLGRRCYRVDRPGEYLSGNHCRRIDPELTLTPSRPENQTARNERY
jgi:hypothetical protein